MGGSPSKPSPPPTPRSPSPTVRISPQSVQNIQKAAPLPPPPTPKTPAPIDSANIKVTHDLDNYIVQKNVAPMPGIPILNGIARNVFSDRHNLKVCTIYNSKKTICVINCHRFHVCMGWIIGKCDGSDCDYDHNFSSSHNSGFLLYLINRKFSEDNLKEQLCKNCEFGKKRRSKRTDEVNICPFYITNICKQERCKQIHIKDKFSWEIKDNTWVRFPNEMSDALEKKYCNPENEGFTLNAKDFSLSGKKNDHLVKLIGMDGSFVIDFELMNLTTSNYVQHSMRRLSTPSDVFNNHHVHTRWLWYEENLGNWTFIRHGKSEKFYQLSLSDYLETQYQNNIASVSLPDAQIDFVSMLKDKEAHYGCTQQCNLRRRPVLLHATIQTEAEQCKFRDMWSILPSDKETYTKETLVPGSYEYQMVKHAIIATSQPNIIKIERIQNPYLWKKYQIKRRELLFENEGDETKLNEQYLFHGTKFDVLHPICQHNLDWRLYSTHVGSVYGQGTYFANSASIADGYSSGNPKIMLMVMVLVGDACVGNSSMRLPPENSRTSRPFDSTVNAKNDAQIFVKYNSNEFYPAYAVHYDWN